MIRATALSADVGNHSFAASRLWINADLCALGGESLAIPSTGTASGSGYDWRFPARRPVLLPWLSLPDRV